MGRAASPSVVKACVTCAFVVTVLDGVDQRQGFVAEMNASIEVFAIPGFTVVVAETVAQGKGLPSDVMLAMLVLVISDFENVHPSGGWWFS